MIVAPSRLQRNAIPRKLLISLAKLSGRSAAWLARLVRDQEVDGSNPFAPTTISRADHREFGRFILAAMVAGWWMEGDLPGRSALPSIVVRNWPRSLGTSSAEILLFWVAPITSLAIFLFFCFANDRTLLKQRRSLSQMARRTGWRLASFVIPLHMVAAGVTAIFEENVSGRSWLVSAGVVSRIGTGFLRRAEGMKFQRLKSGELHNRAFKIASQMGVTIPRVYMVPAGKGHLTNAYGRSNAIGLSDSLGKYLTKAHVDYVIVHELAHVKLRLACKHLLLVFGIFFTMTVLLLRSFQYALPLQMLAQIPVILGPLGAIYYFSRQFKYSADRVAAEFTPSQKLLYEAGSTCTKLAKSLCNTPNVLSSS